jgi:hypothetical protein
MNRYRLIAFLLVTAQDLIAEFGAIPGCADHADHLGGQKPFQLLFLRHFWLLLRGCPAFGAFCLAGHFDAVLRRHQNGWFKNDISQKAKQVQPLCTGRPLAGSGRKGAGGAESAENGKIRGGRDRTWLDVYNLKRGIKCCPTNF